MKNKILSYLLLVTLLFTAAFYKPGPLANSLTQAKIVSPQFQKKASSKTTEIRIYTINKGQMDAFVKAWQKGVYPLRTKFGFKIENAWIIKEKNKFIWVISYDGPEGFVAKDSAYYASQQRQILSPDPSQYVADRENYYLQPAIPQ